MRINNNLIIRHWIRDYAGIQSRLDRTLHMVSTGRRFTVPSDDPVRMSQSIRTQTDLFELEQYQKNIGDAKAWMEASDSAMRSISQILQRIRELAVYGGNGTLPQDSRDAIAMEIDSLLQELVNIGNTNLGGRYIFSGRQTTQIPYAYDSLIPGYVYQGDSGVLRYEIGKGVTIEISMPGGSLFNDGTINLLDEIMNMSAALKTPGGDPTAYLPQIDRGIDNLLRWESELGARLRRIELAESRSGEISQYLTQIDSEQVDIDLAEVVIQLKTQESVLQAALAVGARIIQPSLVEFLR